MSRMRQTIAKRLKESQNTAALLTTFNEVDMTNIMEVSQLVADVVLYYVMSRHIILFYMLHRICHVVGCAVM